MQLAVSKGHMAHASLLLLVSLSARACAKPASGQNALDVLAEVAHGMSQRDFPATSLHLPDQASVAAGPTSALLSGAHGSHGVLLRQPSVRGQSGTESVSSSPFERQRLPLFSSQGIRKRPRTPRVGTTSTWSKDKGKELALSDSRMKAAVASGKSPQLAEAGPSTIKKQTQTRFGASDHRSTPAHTALAKIKHSFYTRDIQRALGGKMPASLAKEGPTEYQYGLSGNDELRDWTWRMSMSAANLQRWKKSGSKTPEQMAEGHRAHEELVRQLNVARPHIRAWSHYDAVAAQIEREKGVLKELPPKSEILATVQTRIANRETLLAEAKQMVIMEVGPREPRPTVTVHGAAPMKNPVLLPQHYRKAVVPRADPASPGPGP